MVWIGLELKNIPTYLVLYVYDMIVLKQTH